MVAICHPLSTSWASSGSASSMKRPPCPSNSWTATGCQKFLALFRNTILTKNNRGSLSDLAIKKRSDRWNERGNELVPLALAFIMSRSNCTDFQPHQRHQQMSVENVVKTWLVNGNKRFHKSYVEASPFVRWANHFLRSLMDNRFALCTFHELGTGPVLAKAREGFLVSWEVEPYHMKYRPQKKKNGDSETTSTHSSNGLWAAISFRLLTMISKERMTDKRLAGVQRVVSSRRRFFFTIALQEWTFRSERNLVGAWGTQLKDIR